MVVDVCFSKPDADDPLIRNCLDVGKDCRTSNLSHTENLACRADALIHGLSGLSGESAIQGARCLLHSDSTYVMAQLIGFNAWQAYQMMIYNEATDQSEYTAFNQQGLQILSDTEVEQCRDHWGSKMPNKCLILTSELNGIYKFNYYTGGMLLHLHARFSPTGQEPPPANFPTSYFSSENLPYENLLTNFRAWVFNERLDACAAGITKNLNTPNKKPGSCEELTYTLTSPMSFFSLGFSKLAIPFVTQLGTLILEDRKKDGFSSDVLANNTSFKNYILPHDIAYAKMGIFLHTLADRYSHHMCTDNSYFYREADGNYTSYYSPTDCAQGSHFLWHVWEQGTNQSTANLAIEHQTMRPALEAVYEQLIDYAHYQKIPINPKLNKQTIIDELIVVLQTLDPTERLNQMVNLTEHYQLLPLPGHGSMAKETPEAWLKRAGAPV